MCQAVGANPHHLDSENLLEWVHELTIPRSNRISQSRTFFPLEALKRTRRYRAFCISSPTPPKTSPVTNGDTESFSPIANPFARQNAFCSPTQPSSPDLSSTAPIEATVARLPWQARRERLQHLLEKAQGWAHEIESGAVENAAALASREQLTRARVSQVLRLRTLAPEILADLTHGEPSLPVPTEPQLRKLALLRTPAAQRKAYRQLLRQERAAIGSRAASNPDRRAHRRGFQQLFALARKYQAMCESGRYRSLRELGDVEGISGERVGQVLALLSLAPDIIAKLDVPPELLPRGLGWKDLLKLTRVREWEQQRQAFSRCVKEVHTRA